VPDFAQVTIIGTGLIGGSFGLAVKKHGFKGRVIGCDRPAILERAKQIGAIDIAVSEPEASVKSSDLILLATPVGTIIDLIERIGPVAPPHALLTDVGGTKSQIAARARAVLGQEVSKRFLPGHPMTGKEFSGIEQASADLFADSTWLIAPYSEEQKLEPGAEQFLRTLERIGARVVSIDPKQHDRICAWVSHLPQFLSTALAATLAEEFSGNSLPEELGGRALRDMTRVAASPYSIWRDIALTNTENIHDALLRLEQTLSNIRENLNTRELEAEFRRANEFRKPSA
jgi:prephenate dehydrogenase